MLRANKRLERLQSASFLPLVDSPTLCVTCLGPSLLLVGPVLYFVTSTAFLASSELTRGTNRRPEKAIRDRSTGRVPKFVKKQLSNCFDATELHVQEILSTPFSSLSRTALPNSAFEAPRPLFVSVPSLPGLVRLSAHLSAIPGLLRLYYTFNVVLAPFFKQRPAAWACSLPAEAPAPRGLPFSSVRSDSQHHCSALLNNNWVSGISLQQKATMYTALDWL